MNNLDWSTSTVLITGGTGSFGKTLVESAVGARQRPKKLIIYSRDELKQHEMRQMFSANPPTRPAVLHRRCPR